MLRRVISRKKLAVLIVLAFVLGFIGINSRWNTPQQALPRSLEEVQQPLLIPPFRDTQLKEGTRVGNETGHRSLSMPDLPGVFNYLPHLIDRPDALIPHVNISRGRTGVELVIGIPSIKRPIDIYIYGTIKSLISGMDEEDKKKVLIIVCITEPWEEAYEQTVIAEIDKRFGKELSEGLLEVIAPKAEYYPDFTNLRLTLGDGKERVRWRSKQNLDYAFLMLHAWKRGRYYIQLEDDISALPGYVKKMEEAITKQYGDWFLLEFSTLGFIGRLFKTSDVPKIMEFLLMFYNQKPCDWLLDDYLRVHSCGHGEVWKRCLQKIKQIARPMTPSLFQHEGFHSSLQGTVNKLKDKHFGVNGSAPSLNPHSDHIISTIKTYGKFDIVSAYMGKNIFWGAEPIAGDIIDFIYNPPIAIARIYFKSGQTDHEGDIFRDTAVEVLASNMGENKVTPEKTEQQKHAYEQLLLYIPDLPKVDMFQKVGFFDEAGRANCEVPERLGNVHVIRIRVNSEPKSWVILEEIKVELRH